MPSTLKNDQNIKAINTADNFLNIPLTPDNMDIYYVRSSIKNAINNNLNIFKGALLDLGCGEMPYKQYILSNSKVEKYIGLDIENPTYQKDTRPDLFWDGQQIPLENNSIDCVIATEFFEHIPYPEKTLAEVRRILKTEGIILLTVPFIWPIHTMPHDEYRYTPFSLERILKNSGFVDIEIKALGGWDASFAQVMGLWIRRRPTSDNQRREYEEALFPLYKSLIESDQIPSDFNDSMLITGLTATAKKISSINGCSERTTIQSMSERIFYKDKTEIEINKIPVLAIVCPQVGAVSETFIRKHIELLNPEHTVILTGKVLDKSWFQGPTKIIPIELGKYSFNEKHSNDVAAFLKEHSVTHILCEFGCIGGAVVELNHQKLHLPIFVHFHGQDASEFLRRPEIAAYYKLMGGLVNGVIAVSKPMAERLTNVGIPKEKIRIIHYGVFCDPKCGSTPKDNPCRFLSVSRLVGKKGIRFVLQAFEKVNKAIPDTTLNIIGDGPLRKDIESFISDHGLTDSVRLHGEQTHKYVMDMMNKSSVFVQHSIVDPETGNAEGLPLSILEASTHGLPVISTFHEGIPEAIEHECTGFLVKEKDWEMMAEYMIRLANDLTLRKNMGIAGRKKIINGGFTLDAMIDKLQDFMGLNSSAEIDGNRIAISPAVTRVLFVNHNIYPFEFSGTPLSTLNHALGMVQRGLDVAVLIPQAEVKKGYWKEHMNGFTLYQIPAMDKFDAYFAESRQNSLSEYRRTIHQIIADFSPQIVQINDYVYMPAEIIELFSRNGCLVVRNVCNCEELCHKDYPVLSSGLNGRLCSGPESPLKCADCFDLLQHPCLDDGISKDAPVSVNENIERRFEYIKNLYRNSIDKVIFTSEPFKTYFTRFIPIPEKRMTVIPRGFKFDFPREVSRRINRDGVVHFAYVGNIMFSKGIDVMLHAFEKICEDNNFVLHIYGLISSSEYQVWIEGLKSRFPDRFIYHGRFEEKDLPEIASNIDVCVIPSYFDTYNRVLREFLYLGIPVISTDFFGAHIVDHGRNGFRIPIGDSDALAGKMIDLIRNPSMVMKLACGAAQTRIPSLEEETEQIIETYNDLYTQASETKKTGRDKTITYDKKQKPYADCATRLIAFYLPQFHPIPENDEWWGEGFTEWTNVAKAKPSFNGHYQPHMPADLGFYDLRLPDARQSQAELARLYGIDGFCYWHYWFSGKRLLDKPFQSVLESGEPDFPFCLAWANETWSRRWLGEERDILIKQEYSEDDDYNHALWLTTAFKDKRYIKVYGRPLFLIYRPKDLPDPDKTIEIFRRVCSNNDIEEPYLVGIDAHCKNMDFRSLGFDETLSFMPQLSYLPDCMNDNALESKRQRNLKFGVDNSKLKIYDYEESMDAMLAGLKLNNHPIIPSLFVGWDNTPRRGENGIVITNASPEKFGRELRSLMNSVQKKPPQQRLVFLNAWNEWAEGNHLEPDIQNGHNFLEQVRDVKLDYKINKIDKSEAPDPEGEILKVRAIAFYLPQYHPIIENNVWWGKGFTEWTNVAKAKPLFQGHYQPHIPADLGFYDLRLPETRKAQADLAKEYGIYGFCYYHYWFNGKSLLDFPIKQVLESEEPDFPFCLCWANENWTRSWDGQNSDILIMQNYSLADDLKHIRHLSRFFKDRRYIKINGKPLFIVYRASNLPNPLQTTLLWREEARKLGIGELFLCRVERFVEDMTDPVSLGFDAAIEFQPDGIHLGRPAENPSYKDNFVYGYEAMVKAALSKKDSAYLRFPCVCPSWDNSPRRQKNAVIFNRSTPQLYESWLKEVITKTARLRPEERIVFINAFNEWGEGCHLEPDQMFGKTYLEATRRAVLSCNGDTNFIQDAPKSFDQKMVHEVYPYAATNPRSGTSHRVSIIIPLFNKLEFTKRCLNAIIENTPDELYEVIIVDNASTDGTHDFLTYLEGDVTVITNRTNLGFSKACNQGASAAQGSYLLFLNNDTEPRKGWLEPLLAILDNDRNVAAVGSKLLFPDGTIQHAGVLIIEDRKLPDPLVARHIYYQQSSDLPHTKQMRTYQALTAACLLVRKDSFEKVYGFDEGYWNGYEDVDLCFKLQENGEKLVYQPESIVIHYESKSGPERFKQTDQNINRLHYRWMNKIKPDIIINQDGSINDTDAHRIHPYFLQLENKLETHVPVPEIQSKFISIVILTFNQLEYTIKCIESLKRHTLEPHEIIFVDNGSTDGTREYLEGIAKVHSNVELILNNENQGFAKGNNQGIAKAKGNYILLLNNDVVVTKHWLNRLISHLERDPDNGMVGPMSNMASGPQQLGKVLYEKDIKAMRKFARNFAAKNMGKSSEILRLVGFCLLIKRHVLDIIGGLDENYGNGNYEDDDLCLRSRIAGFRNIIAHDVFIHHYGSMTFKGNAIDYTASMQDNRKYFADKWKGIVRISDDGAYSVSMSGEEQLKKLIEWGEDRFSKGDLRSAVKIFERVLKLDRVNSQALNNLGVIQWQLGDPVSAIKTFQNALSNNPNDTDALGNLVQAAMETGRFDLINPGLLKTLKKIQSANPDFDAIIDAMQNSVEAA